MRLAADAPARETAGSVRQWRSTSSLFPSGKKNFTNFKKHYSFKTIKLSYIYECNKNKE